MESSWEISVLIPADESNWIHLGLVNHEIDVQTPFSGISFHFSGSFFSFVDSSTCVIV